ncbi:hypothetical protein B0J14DRAFT_441648, partial [Halenospora varia]
LRYAFIVIFVGLILAIPLLLFRRDQAPDDDSLKDKNTKNLIFYLFAWFETTWLFSCVVDMFVMAIPYVFRFAAGYINPAYKRYWRILRAIRKPVTVFAAIIIAQCALEVYITTNDSLAVYYGLDANTVNWDDILGYILFQCIFASALYLIEKVLMLYITIHYHYRSDQKRNTRSKELHTALTTLYEASVYSYPLGSPSFIVEDTLISNPGSDIIQRVNQGKEARQFLGRLGFGSGKTARFFGNMRTNPESHWFTAGTAYAIVERALADPKSAAALATRIWKSLVEEGQDALKKEDIVEAFGPYRREEALATFKAIDENESNDIRLDEIVWTVVEAGRVRRDIYRQMADVNHCLNTFEWVILTLITVAMTFFILTQFIDQIKQIQTTIGTVFVGLGFAAGRTVNKFLQGSILVFFEHPFDVGDRVQVYNMGATNSVSVIVKSQSLLYTVFQRVDNMQTLQMMNMRLAEKRIENVTRSGVNKESRSVYLDIDTTFVEIMALRAELEAFLKANPRDYLPALGLSVKNIHELEKMELGVSWTHKTNWENEPLRAKRSTRFMCALIAAVRKLNIKKPAQHLLGHTEKPVWQVQIASEEAKM